MNGITVTTDFDAYANAIYADYSNYNMETLEIMLNTLAKIAPVEIAYNDNTLTITTVLNKKTWEIIGESLDLIAESEKYVASGDGWNVNFKRIKAIIVKSFGK